jgi:hypothetical protein
MPMPRPELTDARFNLNRLHGSKRSRGRLKGNHLGDGFSVTVYYRTLVWQGTITGPAAGGNWPFQVFPTVYLNIGNPRSDMITVTVTNPSTGQTSDPKDADPQPVIVP